MRSSCWCMASSNSLAAPVPRLEDLCLTTLADNIQLVASLHGLPEELVCCLFDVSFCNVVRTLGQGVYLACLMPASCELIARGRGQHATACCESSSQEWFVWNNL